MIIPTPDFDPLFAFDGVPFAEKMNAYIQREFADILEPHHSKLLATFESRTATQPNRPIANLRYRVDQAEDHRSLQPSAAKRTQIGSMTTLEND